MSPRQPKLLILRGLPASGKTTYAHAWVAQDRKNRVRVNKDDLRMMIDNGTYEKGITEQRILAARDVLVQQLMQRGLSVVVDDTNLRRYHLTKLIKMAHEAQWEWIVKDFLTPLEECIRRDLDRSYDSNIYVGASAIRDMHSKFVANGLADIPTEDELATVVTEAGVVTPYRPDTDLPTAVIFDIDGTIALKGTRNPFDESRVHEDTPKQEIIDAIHMEQAAGRYIIFCSARTDECRAQTMEWILNHVWDRFSVFDTYVDIPKFDLYMRQAGDSRRDAIVKMEIFDRYIRNQYNVRRVYDDRNQVVRMWRSLGLTVLQVADGAF